MEFMNHPNTSTYEKLLAVIGLTTFWLCFSSLWHNRSAQDIDLPLDPFAGWAEKGQRVGDEISLFAIYACWPFVITTLYLLWRMANLSAKLPRWERLPDPFSISSGLVALDKKLYRSFLMVMFLITPLVHVAHFTYRFFAHIAPEPLFQWTAQAWFKGAKDGAGNDILCGGLTYFGWTPILIMIGILVIGLQTVLLVKSTLRSASQNTLCNVSFG